MMLMPTSMLLIGLPLAQHLTFSSGPDTSPTSSASAIDDPKITRTVKAFRANPQTHKHPSRLKTVGRPGMHFRIRMPQEVRDRYQVARGSHSRTKFYDEEVGVAIEEGPEFAAIIHVRGGSSTHADKKSFAVNLITSQRFTDEFKARKFFLINLLRDPFGFKFRFSYELLRELGVFYCYNQFAVVAINDEPQGLYLLVERPVDAIRGSFGEVASVYRQRRGWKIEEKYLAPGKAHREIFLQLRNVCEMPVDENQVGQLEKLIDLEQYHTWMAFNSLVQNADTLGELFWFEQRAANRQQDIGRLRIMAWDYDDLQRPPAHLKYTMVAPLIWAAENEVDQLTIKNPALYARYKTALVRLLQEKLTESHLRETMDRIHAVLDGIDTGFPPSQQAEERTKRAVEIDAFLTRLINRRLELLRRSRAQIGKAASAARTGDASLRG